MFAGLIRLLKYLAFLLAVFGPGLYVMAVSFAPELIPVHLLAKLAQAGVQPSQCQGKIFGGGNMFPKHSRSSTMHIGRRNGEAARALLQAHGIPIVS